MIFSMKFLAKRFCSIPFLFLSPERKNFRVLEMVSGENLEHTSISSHPAWRGIAEFFNSGFELWLNLKTRFSK